MRFPPHWKMEDYIVQVFAEGTTAGRVRVGQAGGPVDVLDARFTSRDQLERLLSESMKALVQSRVPEEAK